MHAPPPISDVVSAGLDAPRSHLDFRSGRAADVLIAEWQSDRSYPYQDEPASEVEAAERALFDEVVLTAAPVLRSVDARSRKLSLRLIKEAIERYPAGLKKILSDVLDLSDEQLAIFSQILEKTSLPKTSSSANLIASRLEFLQGLSTLLFEKDTRRSLLEREQLHPILEQEAWIFGDEYHLTASELGLTNILRKHLEILGRHDLLGTRSVKINERSAGRLDLMFTRTIDSGRRRLDHLVVEIKRPSVRLGLEEMRQIQQYAFAVSDDERFSGRDVRWDFVLVGNDADSYVGRAVDSDGIAPQLPGTNGAFRIRVLTWSQIIDKARQRLEFVRNGLELETSVRDGVQYLRKVHGRNIPEIITDAEEEPGHGAGGIAGRDAGSAD